MTPERIYVGVLQFAVLLFSLAFHEFGHAWTAVRRGDPTPRDQGRLTLNPMAHADLLGTIIFPLMQIFGGVPLIGWAKPVQFNPRFLRNGARDIAMVGVAGPGFNLILAFSAALLLRLDRMLLGGAESGAGAALHGFLSAVLPLMIQMNVLLAIFNLIPIPPLDGGHLLEHLLPPEMAARYRAFGATWGFVVVIALVYTGVARKFINFGASLVAPVLRAVVG
jgi:Zn-dependent protease